MTDSLDIAKNVILAPAGITETNINQTLSALFSTNVDAADIYFQARRHESWSLDDGIIKEGTFSLDEGVGIRAVSGDKTGFAYSDEITQPVMLEAAQTAKAIAKAQQTRQIQIKGGQQEMRLYDAINPLQSISAKEKIDLLREIDALARSIDPRVKQVMANLIAVYDVVLIVDSNGELKSDVRPMVRIGVNVIVEQNERREQGSSGGGGRQSYQYLIETELYKKYTHEAVRQALVNLDAIDAPAGSMNIVLGPGWPGVLLHEAIGHGLEGDFNRKKTSAFCGRLGEKVASENCTVVDDGTLAGRRGSLNIDDEGTPSQCTVLIENGILKGYMQDKMNARLMGVAPTGNGRRESYAYLPLPRMTNTYMTPGQHDPKAIIESVDSGLYAVNFGGGQVDITSGKFVFSASEAYLIEKGKITTPVKGATLIGNGPDVLTRVTMVGNDLALDEGVGICGKEGQSVPVGVGQPTIRIDGITVGGTSME